MRLLVCLSAVLLNPSCAGRVKREFSDLDMDSNVTECDLSRYNFGGRFTELTYAGAGANGCVVLANDNDNGGVRVAIKVSKQPGKLRSWQQECTATKSFHKKACQTSELQKALSERFLPNCLEVGGSDNAPFIIMHAAGGEGLGAKGKMLNDVPPQERLSVFAQIVGALTSLHGIGMSHNDLHDNNVVYVQKGIPTVICLIDFGETVPLAQGLYQGNYKQDENLIIKRGMELANCPDAGKANLFVCLRQQWGPKGADDEFFKVLGEVYDEAKARQHPLHVPKLFQTAFIQKHLPSLPRLFPNTECEQQEPTTDVAEINTEDAAFPACVDQHNYEQAKVWCGLQTEEFACYKDASAKNPIWDCRVQSADVCEQPCRWNGAASTTTTTITTKVVTKSQASTKSAASGIPSTAVGLALAWLVALS